ncbi:MAG: helix-turn-helix transcriptional regulator [Lachnospiraceae bacterium]
MSRNKEQEVDYIYCLEENKILIETIQKKSRLEIIQKYRECRIEQGITQVELSKRTGISQPNITRFESGAYNPSLEMMVKIATALGMELQMGLAYKSMKE